MTNFNGEDFGTTPFGSTGVKLCSIAPNNALLSPMPILVVTNNRTGMIDQVPFKLIGTTTRPLYRGTLSGSYVYSVGSPPGGGATDIVVVNTGESTYT